MAILDKKNSASWLFFLKGPSCRQEVGLLWVWVWVHVFKKAVGGWVDLSMGACKVWEQRKWKWKKTDATVFCIASRCGHRAWSRSSPTSQAWSWSLPPPPRRPKVSLPCPSISLSLSLSQLCCDSTPPFAHRPPKNIPTTPRVQVSPTLVRCRSPVGGQRGGGLELVSPSLPFLMESPPMVSKHGAHQGRRSL